MLLPTHGLVACLVFLRLALAALGPLKQRLPSQESRKLYYDFDSEDLDCWDGVYTRARCCPSPGRPHGDALCWAPPFTHKREFCCDTNLALTRDARIRGQLQSRLSFPSAASLVPEEVIDENLFGRLIPIELSVSWNSNRSEARPVASLAALLRALRRGAPQGVARRAYAMILAVSRPVLDHLESGWPIFALLQLIAFSRYGKATLDGLQRADSKSTCLACISKAAPGGSLDCALACFAAARQVPAGRELQGATGESRSAVAALRELLLQHGETELRALGVGAFWELSRRGAWAILHELQQKGHQLGACPEGFFLFRTSAEPSYDLCLPLHATAAGDWAWQHFLDVMLINGRWRDCDPLHSLAVMSNVVHIDEAVAVDVGFNTGACTSYLLAMGMKVHGLDPDAESCSVLRGAAWEAEESGKLVVHFASASDLERPGTSSTVAPAVRLDRLLSDEPGPMLIKIDVEGDEYAVLRGAFGLFQTRRVRAITMELHRQLLSEMGVDPWEPIDLLIKADFRVSLLPWYFPENDDRKSYEVTTVEGFRALAKEIEDREGPNFQVIATLPAKFWKTT